MQEVVIPRGRRPMEPGTHGSISAKRQADGVWIAQARARDIDGSTHNVGRRARTRAAAIAAVRSAIEARTGFREEAQERRRLREQPHRVVPFASAGVKHRRRPHVMYRFFDGADRLLYVGISLHGVRRMVEHRDGKDWWTDVVRTEFEHFPDYDSAREAERIAIHDEHPLHNIAA